MTITYQKALEILQDVAKARVVHDEKTETVSLLDALGRVAARDHVSPTSTPLHDTSAMDGYAISSAATANASTECPVIFAVKGTMAAGDLPIALENEPENGVFSCVEIMTGARFPESESKAPFDACIKIEDTVSLGLVALGSESKACTHIVVKKPLSPNANRRLAGGDVKTGDVVLPRGRVVCSRHIMALASVGITEIVVRRRIRVAVWSTGNELSEGPDNLHSASQILNSNGPFLCAALRELNVIAEYKGILKDDPRSLEAALSAVDTNTLDLVITTGAVSKGKFDFIVPALEELQADVRFHGVAIRPGHPVLFATTNRKMGGTPLFGLPGNPIATAACFRFLVVPFLKHLLGLPQEQPDISRLSVPGENKNVSMSPSRLDCFRHGTLNADGHGATTAILSSNQSPAVISHFAGSNCWLHIPSDGSSALDKALVYCYPHNASLE